MIKKIVKGFSAGFLIGMAGALFMLAKAQGFRLLPSLVFPVGLFLICTFGFDLYTGKIGFVFDKTRGIKIADLITMLVSNAVGAMLFGLIFTAIFGGDAAVSAAAEAVAKAKFGELTALSAALVLLKSALCGILVYIGVYLFGKSEGFGAKALAIWIPIASFVYLGLDHSIANMFYLSAMISFSLEGAALIVIAIVGNSIGAIAFDRALALIR